MLSLLVTPAREFPGPPFSPSFAARHSLALLGSIRPPRHECRPRSSFREGVETQFGQRRSAYPQTPTTRSKQPCSAKGPGMKLPGSASVAPMAATVPGRKPSLASNPPGRGCGGRLRARRLAHIPFCGEWRGAYLIRIMPPVPLPRGWAWERAAQDARLLAAVSTATPCVASRKLPARGDAPSLCMRAAGRACFSRPIFYHFRPLEASSRADN
jgi:hypothetical protein